MENTRNKLADAEQLISSQDKLVRDLEEKIQENSFRGAEPAAERSEADGAEAPEEQQLTQSRAITPDLDNKQISDPLREEELGRLTKECKSLQELVQKLEEKNANLQVSVLSNLSVLYHLCHETWGPGAGEQNKVDHLLLCQPRLVTALGEYS